MARASAAEIDRVKNDNPISSIVGRFVTWDRHKTNARAGDYWACCPFHGESTPSFHCEDKKGRYHCFGCNEGGDVIEFVQRLQGLSFGDAVKYLGGRLDLKLDPEVERQRQEKRRQDQEKRQQEQEETAEEKRRKAVAYFRMAKPVAGTPAEAYLLGRGINLDRWPQRLRFAKADPLEFPPYGDHPALLCGVTNAADDLISVWRIYLDSNGGNLRGKDGEKLKLGRAPSKGGAVRLGPVARRIALTEGVETALGVMMLLRADGDDTPVWSALATAGLMNLEPPPEVREIDIYADDDTPRFPKNGDLKPVAPGEEAAIRAKQRFEGMGIKVRVFYPQAYGADWLDCAAQLTMEREAAHGQGR